MKIKVGISGARGLNMVMGLNDLPNVSIEAVCDIDAEFLDEQAKKYNIPKKFRVFEDMLATDIDAVIVSTPMQLHFPQVAAALEAGKHVMSEVPAAVTMDELWWLIECVEKYKKVYMLAENFCYIPENQLVKTLAKKGFFGEIYFGEGEYLHDLKHMAVYNYSQMMSSRAQTSGKTSWRSFWQLGKRGAFYPTHSVGPVMKFFEDEHIGSVTCHGVGWYTNEKFRQDDTSITMCRLRSGKLIKIRIDCISNRPHLMNYYSLQGTKGCYEAPRGFGDKHKIYFKEDDTIDPQWRSLDDFKEYLPERYKNATAEQVTYDNHWGGDYFIMKDFIDAVRMGTKPAIDVYEACEWTSVALLSELSVMNGGREVEMPDFRKNLPRSEQIIKI